MNNLLFGENHSLSNSASICLSPFKAVSGIPIKFNGSAYP